MLDYALTAVAHGDKFYYKEIYMKKIFIVFLITVTSLSVAACGNGNDDQDNIGIEQSDLTSESGGVSNKEADIEATEAPDLNQVNEDDLDDETKLSSSELLDKAIAGEIPVNATTWDGEPYTFYITDLSFDENDYEFYKIGDRVDLDNDGEEELILDSPFYGGMYIDARDGQVYVLAEGDGTAMWLSHTTYKGKTYVCYSNSSHDGYETYYGVEYNGLGEEVDSFYLEAEYLDSGYLDETATCYFNNEQISVSEYEAIKAEIFNY